MAELDWLMHQAKRYPLLTADQEIELSRQVQTWLQLKDKPNLTADERVAARQGQRAYDRFFMSNINMVVKLAYRCNYSYIAGSLTLDDLVQEGIFGLQRAIVMFDATRGYKFSTYAFNWIRQCINRGIERRGHLIYMTCTMHDMIAKARRYIREQEQLQRRTLSVAETAAAIGVNELKLREALHLQQLVLSLDEPAPVQGAERSNSTLVDLLPSKGPDPSAVAELNHIVEAMPRLLATLKPEQQEVICRRYLTHKPDTYDKIAKEWGVSREAVRQHHDRAIRMLRKYFSAVATPADIQALQCA